LFSTEFTHQENDAGTNFQPNDRQFAPAVAFLVEQPKPINRCLWRNRWFDSRFHRTSLQCLASHPLWLLSLSLSVSFLALSVYWLSVFMNHWES
jgi:hypothetical protein